MHVLRYGAVSRKPNQRFKIDNACIKIGMHVLRYAIASGKAIVRLIVKRYGMTLFGNVRHFGANFFEFFPGAPRVQFLRRGLIMTPAVDFYACTYCFDLMQCEETVVRCMKIGYNLVMH